MINLYPRYQPQEFEIDDIFDVIENLSEFLAPAVAEIDSLPLSTMSMRICKWQTVPDKDTYLSLNLLVDLKNIPDFKLRVHDGYFSSCNNAIIDGDGFVDIKTDTESIRQALADIKNGTIPLHNRVDKIDYEKYPYTIQDEGEDY